MKILQTPSKRDFFLSKLIIRQQSINVKDCKNISMMVL